MKCRRHCGSSLVSLLAALCIIVYLAGGSPGDAKFWRTRNYVPFELLRTMNSDFFKTRNYEAFELKRTMNMDVTKLRNYEAFEIRRTMNADVTKLRNYLAFQMREPSELGLAVNIGPILTTDQNGNIVSTFMPGDIVQFEFAVENIGNSTLTNGLISTQLLDPSETPIFLNYFFETLSPGSHRNYVVGYSIPLEGPTGTYTVRVMSLTNWPSQGGTGLDIETTTFEVLV